MLPPGTAIWLRSSLPMDKLAAWLKSVAQSARQSGRWVVTIITGRVGMPAADRRSTSPVVGSIQWASSTTIRTGEDRKSVVSGKSVSVRVDHGGRRLINKKKHHSKTR